MFAVRFGFAFLEFDYDIGKSGTVVFHYYVHPSVSGFLFKIDFVVSHAAHGSGCDYRLTVALVFQDDRGNLL